MSGSPEQHPFHLAFRQRKLFRDAVEASVEIEASIATVWSVLTDFDDYSRWNPFTPRVRGTLQVGAPVELHVCMPGKAEMVRVEWVNRVEPQRRICWGAHIGHAWLVTANRWQELEPLGPERTRYRTSDRFSGLLVPLVMALYGRPMQRGFHSMAEALKQRAETVQRERAMLSP